MTAPGMTRPPDGELDAARITTASNSNLAFAFFCLPAYRRRDMAVFYAFCRLADDIADEPGITRTQRHARLDSLRRWIDGSGPAEPALARDLRDVMSRHAIDPAHLHAILDGVACDIDPKPFATIDELLAYCYLVACEVGLVSIAIFGCRHPDAPAYATQLGYALQLTNILRDVGEDFANGGRIYLPLEDLEAAGLDPCDLPRSEGSPAFRAVMEKGYTRARGFHLAAADLLPRSDRRKLLAAEIMRTVYARLLAVIRRDGFRVLSHRYALGRTAKLACVVRALAGVHPSGLLPD